MCQGESPELAGKFPNVEGKNGCGCVDVNVIPETYAATVTLDCRHR